MKSIKKYFLIAMASLMMMPLSGCDEEGNVDWKAVEDLISWLLSKTGWLADKEDDGKVPDEIIPNGDETNLPARVDLSAYFPPIGDQGSYGTCVVWATGYNLKTALNAKQKGVNPAQAVNQTSPKDLWFAIEDKDKSPNCNGTNFEPSLSALQTRGAANMADVPYSSMGTCSGAAKTDSNNKLQQFRQIAYKDVSGGGNDKGMTKDNFKAYLRDGKPIAFGAQLGERFMAWTGAGVLSSDTKDYKGQHAYHALALVGYDDSQGTKGAFRVRNSWGEKWGDNGSIWIDYDFFINQFCFSAYIADNAGTAASAPKRAKSNLAVSASDFGDKSVKVQVSGTAKVVFMYYNAANANEYGVLAQADLSNTSKTLTYTLPALNGKYYFAAVANPSDENDDFYFLTAADAEPLEFASGVLQNAPAQGISSITDKIPNAYTPAEIKRVLNRK